MSTNNRPSEVLIFESEEDIDFYRLAALKGALRLEILGIRRVPPELSAYRALKQGYGFKGGKEAVLQQATEEVERRIENKRASRERNGARAS